VRVLEFTGIGPGPFATMLLSDLGCEVTRIDRPGGDPRLPVDITSRGRVSVELDLKDANAVAFALDAIARADVLIEGYRPGVMERLGLGPEVALARNPRLVYGRVTGWGQTGPLASAAGHDINYIALTGALHALGNLGTPPPPPLNLVGDFGGGALYLALGVVAALYERDRSGRGQVIDAAIVDGVASLTAILHSLAASFPGSTERGRLGLAGGAPNYRCYECADGEYIAVGALEPQFHAQLLESVGVTLDVRDREPGETTGWAEEIAALDAAFRRRTRDEWAALLERSDACVQPVLALADAAQHPHLAARQTYTEVAGVTQPAPAPRFSRTPGRVGSSAPRPGEGGLARLREWGVSRDL
jgi:alpha-methylacyl-CoA racemase